jgi:siderophore synthetase component
MTTEIKTATWQENKIRELLEEFAGDNFCPPCENRDILETAMREYLTQAFEDAEFALLNAEEKKNELNSIWREAVGFQGGFIEGRQLKFS